MWSKVQGFTFANKRLFIRPMQKYKISRDSPGPTNLLTLDLHMIRNSLPKNCLRKNFRLNEKTQEARWALY